MLTWVLVLLAACLALWPLSVLIAYLAQYGIRVSWELLVRRSNCAAVVSQNGTKVREFKRCLVWQAPVDYAEDDPIEGAVSWAFPKTSPLQAGEQPTSASGDFWILYVLTAHGPVGLSVPCRMKIAGADLVLARTLPACV